MPGAIAFPPGGYAFAPGVFQYSCGARALPGYRIERVRFSRVVPMAEGFKRIAAFLRDNGRPLTAFCACELRSPAPFSEAGFLAFNQDYAAVLGEWGLLPDGVNPVARSNVCPDIDPPGEPGFHAFSFTRPAAGAEPSFVVAGSGEVPEGRANYRDHIVRLGDTGADGLRAKASFVVSEMERRLALLDAAWAMVSGTQVYTVYDLHPFLADILVQRGAVAHGLTWHFARPPVVGLDFEMDCRGVATEMVLKA